MKIVSIVSSAHYILATIMSPNTIISCVFLMPENAFEQCICTNLTHFSFRFDYAKVK